MRTRAFLLVAIVSVALLAAACGRATEAEINQALGITPTATVSAEQLAAATSTAAARALSAAAGQSTPGAVAVAAGDVNRGNIQFTVNCAGCHGPAGAGGNLLEAGGIGANVTADTLQTLIREGTMADGTNHPPGPYGTTRISDATVGDLVAFILDRAGP